MLEVQWHIPNSCRKLFDKSLRQIEARLLASNYVPSYYIKNNQRLLKLSRITSIVVVDNRNIQILTYP